MEKVVKDVRSVFQKAEADLNHVVLHGNRAEVLLHKNDLVNLIVVTNVVRQLIESGRIDKLRQVINVAFPEYFKDGGN
jgi:hypothetical protein